MPLLHTADPEATAREEHRFVDRRRTGDGALDFDRDRVGRRFELRARREGLSSSGHEYGSDLTDTERSELLAYLETL